MTIDIEFLLARIHAFSFGGKVASKASTAAASSQQSAAVLGMYINFLPSSASGTSSQTRSAARVVSVHNKADILLFATHKASANVVTRIAEIDVYIVAHLACNLKGMAQSRFYDFCL